MAVTSFIQQPPASSLQAAYRPIVFRAVAAGATPPPRVYCDIYFGGIYYRTISKTALAKQNATNSEWVFDIQDAAQEYLSKYLAPNGGNDVLEALPVMCRALCKFRTSEYNPDGFIDQETPIPVQATASSAAIAGGGFASNEFFILNATLQHADNQNLATHLNSFKKGTWGATNYPATHRPNQSISLVDSDYFPALISDELCNANLVLHYRVGDSPSFALEEVAIPNLCGALITDISFEQLTATTNALISWTYTGNITGFEYRLDGGAWLATSNLSVTINSLSVGVHTIEVRAMCGCADGLVSSLEFTIVAPASACSSVVTITAVAQNGDGSAQVSFTSSGPATVWQYSVDGGAFSAVPSNPFNITGLSNASHTVTVRPVCSGGAIGTSDTESFEITTWTTVYWYRIRFGANPCGSTLVMVYSTSDTFGSGTILYTDEALTNFLAGPPGGYVAAYEGNGLFAFGEIYNLFTYQVDLPTGDIC